CSAPSSSSRARRSTSIAFARWSWRKLSSSFGPGRRCSYGPFCLLERVTERADKPSVRHLRVASRPRPTETNPCARHGQAQVFEDLLDLTVRESKTCRAGATLSARRDLTAHQPEVLREPAPVTSLLVPRRAASNRGFIAI